nr:10223_t:CDS:2 [Entrophospora candida]
MINSFPYSNFRKRAPVVGVYTQCDGDFPITVVEDTYIPPIYVPGKKTIEHIVLDSTVEIEPKSTLVMTVTLLDGTPVPKFTSKEDYCKSESKPPDIDCPIPAGHLDFTIDYVFPTSPDQPVDKTIKYILSAQIIELYCVKQV